MLPSPSYPTVYFSLHLIVLIFKPRNTGLSNKTNRSPSHAFDPVQINPMAPHFDTSSSSTGHGTQQGRTFLLSRLVHDRKHHEAHLVMTDQESVKASQDGFCETDHGLMLTLVTVASLPS
ncbi:hypothetical protein G6F43_005955 [Rhizopus delemar]|nr:hypothetical protein G6F43_005955 [Rhizopus delemar]